MWGDEREEEVVGGRNTSSYSATTYPMGLCIIILVECLNIVGEQERASWDSAGSLVSAVSQCQ